MNKRCFNTFYFFSGGLPMMSDSVFSLVILVYVSTTFCIVFFLFCWNTPADATKQQSGQQPANSRCQMVKSDLPEKSRLLNSKSSIVKTKDIECLEMKNISV